MRADIPVRIPIGIPIVPGVERSVFTVGHYLIGGGMLASIYSTSSFSSFSEWRFIQQPALSSDAEGSIPVAQQTASDPALADDESQSRDRFALFERVLAEGYQKLEAQFEISIQGDQSLPLADFDSQDKPLTPEVVAGNILGFIERRLQMDQAEGADAEALQQRLEAGLEGFKKGFEEAREQLEALNLLSPEVEDSIGETYDRVLNGIEDLRERFVEAEEAEEPEDEPRVSSSAPPPVGQPSGERVSVDVQQAQRNSFSFKLKTADGDTVTIRANSVKAFAGRYSGVSLGGVTAERYGASYSSENSFSLAIDGELDVDEISAINDLLRQVNDLAADFFAGDLDQAFEAAARVGYDDSEIAGFALRLSHTDVQRVTQAYGGNGERDALSPLIQRLLPVGLFARHLLDMAELASPFAEPLDLLIEMVDQRVRQYSNDIGANDIGAKASGENLLRFPHFVGRLARALASA